MSDDRAPMAGDYVVIKREELERLREEVARLLPVEESWRHNQQKLAQATVALEGRLDDAATQALTYFDRACPGVFTDRYTGAKLKEEVFEFVEAVALYNRGDGSLHDVMLEWADVFICLVVSSRALQIDGTEAVFEKLHAMRDRVWSNPDENGVRRHL